MPNDCCTLKTHTQNCYYYSWWWEYIRIMWSYFWVEINSRDLITKVLHPKLSKKDALSLAYTIDCVCSSMFWPKTSYLEAKIDSFLSYMLSNLWALMIQKKKVKHEKMNSKVGYFSILRWRNFSMYCPKRPDLHRNKKLQDSFNCLEHLVSRLCKDLNLV